jgi:hypothetical protein
MVLENVRDKVKEGIRWCKANPYGAYAGAGAALLLFPGPRSFVFRNIFGAFQSQESAFRSASERFSTASETSAVLLKGKEESLAAARTALEALQAARTQAAAARADLDSLAAKMEAAEHKYDGTQRSMACVLRTIMATPTDMQC